MSKASRSNLPELVLKKNCYIISLILNFLIVFCLSQEGYGQENQEAQDSVLTVRSFIQLKAKYLSGEISFNDFSYHADGKYSSFSNVNGEFNIGFWIFGSNNMYFLTGIGMVNREFESDNVRITSDINTKVHIKLTYLQLPFLFGYVFGKGKVRPYLNAGLGIGILTDSSFEEEIISLTPGVTFSVPNVRFEKGENIFLMGGGIDWALSEKISLILHGRYNWGEANYIVSNSSARANTAVTSQQWEVGFGLQMNLNPLKLKLH